MAVSLYEMTLSIAGTTMKGHPYFGHISPLFFSEIFGLREKKLEKLFFEGHFCDFCDSGDF